MQSSVSGKKRKHGFITLSQWKRRRTEKQSAVFSMQRKVDRLHEARNRIQQDIKARKLEIEKMEKELVTIKESLHSLKHSQFVRFGAVNTEQIVLTERICQLESALKVSAAAKARHLQQIEGFDCQIAALLANRAKYAEIEQQQQCHQSQLTEAAQRISSAVKAFDDISKLGEETGITQRPQQDRYAVDSMRDKLVEIKSAERASILIQNGCQRKISIFDNVLHYMTSKQVRLRTDLRSERESSLMLKNELAVLEGEFAAVSDIKKELDAEKLPLLKAKAEKQGIYELKKEVYDDLRFRLECMNEDIFEKKVELRLIGDSAFR